MLRLVLKLIGIGALLAAGAYGVQRRQLDEKVLMGFEKYFRALVGQEPLT